MTKETDDLQQLIGKPRGWVLRWGISSVLILLLVFVVFAVFFRYPDKLEGSFQLVSGDLPATVLARESGRLSEILVADRDIVEEGHWLGVIENTASTQDVLQLRELLEIELLSSDELVFEKLAALDLGDIQPAYAALEKQISSYREWVLADRTFQKAALLENQIYEQQVKKEALDRKEKLLMEELALADSSLHRQRDLYERGAISLVELEVMERIYFQYQRQIEDNHIQLAEVRRQSNDLDRERLELLESKDKWIAERFPVLRERIEAVSEALESWEQQYVLRAPLGGEVSFSRFWSERQNVDAGDRVFTIVSTESDFSWTSRLVLPGIGSGKVELGNAVSMELNDFPKEQYGVLEGTVESMSLTAEEGAYAISVRMPDSLFTTYGVEIPFRPVLNGRAFVITEDRSLLSRLFDSLRSVVSN